MLSSTENAWGGDVQVHVSITSTVAGDEWTASCLGHFTPGKERQTSNGAPEPV